MADLRIDSEALTRLVAEVGVVRAEFDAADTIALGVADLVGHDQLSDTVRDFASQWNLRRDEIASQLKHVADAAEAIRDTMIELDKDFAHVIESYRPGASGDGGGGGGGGGL